MLSAADDKVIRIWDLKTGRCTRKIEEAHSGFIESLAWGRQVISSGADSKDEGAGRPVNVIATCSVDKVNSPFFFAILNPAFINTYLQTVKIWLP